VYWSPVEPAELIALGVYDPTAPDAEQRLELLSFLVDLGASADELVQYKDNLPQLAGTLSIRGGPVLSVEEVAARAGVSVKEVRHVVRLAGLPDPEPGARVLTEGFVGLATGMHGVAEVFGEEAGYQLLRVLGSAMARVADAVTSAFVVNVGPAALRDAAAIGLARASVDAAALLPFVPPALDTLFRQQLLTAQRMLDLDADQVGYDTQTLVVGFVDLVGSTELSEQLSAHDLGVTLTTFENIATDTVTAGGGRVIKLIGDEILYTAPDATAGAAVALGLARRFSDHPLVPPVRAGLAGGVVLLRDGDAFGPVVNLAARAVKAAPPGAVVATAEVADASGFPFEPCGHERLKGIAEPVELFRLIDR
jgi:class 3 adenylate cyclase